MEKEDGGGSRFNEMTKVWAKAGNEITVLAGMVHYSTGKKKKKYRGKYILQEPDFYENVDVIRCYVSERYNSSFIGRLSAYFSFVLSSSCAGLFRLKGKHDVILVTSPPLFVGITAFVISKIKRLPIVFEIRDLWPESAIDTGVLKSKGVIKLAYWFEGFIYSRAKLICVLTPAFRDTLIKLKKVHENKIILIPNAADFALAEKIQNDHSFNNLKFKKELGLEGKFVITYVGAHGVANHLIQLLDAAEYIRDTNIVFQLIGSGMRKEFLQKEVLKRGLRNIIFRKPVSKSDVFRYILASDAGISVLKNVEAFRTIYSNKTFDYMSCKMPVLLVIDGVSRELVDKAKCGYFAEPENAFDISIKARQLSNLTKYDLDEMGENGYRYAKANFDRAELSKRYIDEIKRSISN